MPSHIIDRPKLTTDSNACVQAPEGFAAECNTPLVRRLLRGTAWSLAGAVAAQTSMVGASLAAARILGPAEFGQLGIIQSTVGMFGVLAGMGLGLTATRYVAHYRDSEPDRAGAVIGLSLGAAILSSATGVVVLYTAAPGLAAHSLNAPGLAYPLRIAALLLFFNIWAGVQQGTLAGFEAFRTIAKVNALSGILGLPLVIFSTRLWRLQGAIWSLVLVAAITCLIGLPQIRQQRRRYAIRILWKRCWQERAVLWNFSFPAALAGSLVGPVTWLANSMLVHQPNGYAEMGLLAAANNIRLCLVALPLLIQSSVLPILANEQKGRSSPTARYNRAIDLAQLSSLAVALPAGTLLILAGGMILTAFGKAYGSGRAVLVPLVAGAMISMVGGAMGSAVTARGRMWLGTALNGLWGSVLLTAMHYLAPSYGAAAFGISFAIAHIVMAIAGLMVLRRELANPVILRVVAMIGYVTLLSPVSLAVDAHTRTMILLALAGVGIVFAFKKLGTAIEHQHPLELFRKLGAKL